MLNKYFILISISFFSSFIISCSSIYSPRYQGLEIDTNYDGRVRAILYSSSGEKKITLPTRISVKSSNTNIIVKIKDDCFVEEEFTIERSISAYTYLNVFNMGVGFFIDTISGNLWSYKKGTIFNVNRNNECDKPIASDNTSTTNKRFAFSVKDLLGTKSVEIYGAFYGRGLGEEFLRGYKEGIQEVKKVVGTDVRTIDIIQNPNWKRLVAFKKGFMETFKEEPRQYAVALGNLAAIYEFATCDTITIKSEIDNECLGYVELKSGNLF